MTRNQHLLNSLESKIPPPVVMLVIAFAMWGARLVTPFFTFHNPYRLHIAGSIALLGFLIEVAGLFLFLQKKTSFDPTHPQSATRLVTRGINRISRNPMYLGDLVILIGWAVYLSNPLALLCVPVFVIYINRFQIRPEEKMLTQLFGTEYTTYCSRVHRWL